MKIFSQDERYIRRCIDIARRGAGKVSPNPLVGSVLVHQQRILSEGYHEAYGGAHAERNAISRLSPDARHLLPESTLYVSLEPCCHYGRTPPCADLIIESGIQEVVVGVEDPNPIVRGKGIQRLREAGVNVRAGILSDACENLIRYFSTYMLKQRPHIVLKIVQSTDGFIGKEDEQVWLSNAYERIWVHKLRSEIDAIMVGTNTAVLDDPELTTRYYPGRNPLRVILDRTLRIPEAHHLFDATAPTLLVTGASSVHRGCANCQVLHTDFDNELMPKVIRHLYEMRIQSVLVEGGAALINHLLEQNLWDEALVVRTPKVLGTGVRAPLIEGTLAGTFDIAGDEVLMITPASAANAR